MKRLNVLARLGSTAILMMFAALVALAPAPAEAQTVLVNGTACTTAVIQFSSAGTVPILPAACSGNGNPCASASVKFASTGIAIQAPPACLTAGGSGAQILQRAVTLNGITCTGAIATWTAGGIAIDAPLACLSATPPAGTAGQFVTIAACPGATVTHSAAGISISAPPACLSVAPHGPVHLLSASSRKTHGTAGQFDIPVDTAQSMSGAVTVESRHIGQGHVIVFSFDAAITSSGVVTAIDSSGAAIDVKVQYSGTDILVTLPSLANNRRVMIALAGINATSSAAVAMGFLLGDTSNSRAVNAADLAETKAWSGHAANASNFRHDLHASGTVNAADIAVVKARMGSILAP